MNRSRAQTASDESADAKTEGKLLTRPDLVNMIRPHDFMSVAGADARPLLKLH